MLGTFDNSPHNTPITSFNGRSLSKTAAHTAKTHNQNLNDLARHEWHELPYEMMRFTSSRMSWERQPIYWRDRNVQLGEIQLTLAKHRADHHPSRYVATYAVEELRRDFAVSPSIEDEQIRWAAPGLCGTAKLTTQQLAEQLVGQLVTFHTQGLK